MKKTIFDLCTDVTDSFVAVIEVRLLDLELFHNYLSYEVKSYPNSEINRPFQSCCEPHYESEAKCKAFHMKISCCFLHINEN